MANEKKSKRRTKVKGLPQPEQELTTEQAKAVKGGELGSLPTDLSGDSGAPTESQPPPVNGKIKFNE